MEYGRGTRGYAALKLREQSYKTVTSHIMYCTDLRSTCIYSTYNTRGMSNMQLKGGPHGAWAGACRTSSGRACALYKPHPGGPNLIITRNAHGAEEAEGLGTRLTFRR